MQSIEPVELLRNGNFCLKKAEFPHKKVRVAKKESPPSPLGGNRIEITLSGRKRGYGGMKLDPIVVEKR